MGIRKRQEKGHFGDDSKRQKRLRKMKEKGTAVRSISL
jgi:hypothetical protein